jgi:hypothetical protein
MNRNTRVIALVVIVHLAINLAHGAAHTAAGVRLGPIGLAFVFIVIMIGPIAGLVWMRWNRTAGAWTIAAAMAGALLFGFVNHFVLNGADRVDHVMGPSRTMFQITAALLFVSEAAGAWLGASVALRKGIGSPDPR